jgi:hypothetical protein
MMLIGRGFTIKERNRNGGDPGRAAVVFYLDVEVEGGLIEKLSVSGWHDSSFTDRQNNKNKEAGHEKMLSVVIELFLLHAHRLPRGRAGGNDEEQTENRRR